MTFPHLIRSWGIRLSVLPDDSQICVVFISSCAFLAMPATSRQRKTYNYSPLGKDEIRLLRLYPGEQWGSDLTGSLETYALLPEDRLYGKDVQVHREDGRIVYLAPDYEAVSYLWGGQNFASSITILEGDQPYYLPITENLRDALERFRAEIPPHSSRLFWIDAICIDQGHDLKMTQRSLLSKNSIMEDEKEPLNESMKKRKEEKSAQIEKMADIYKQASNVRVWLGKESRDSEAAMNFIHRFLELDDLDKLARYPASIVEWDAFRSLMQRPWFRRRWIVQEIAHARSATVHCGRSHITWEDFATAVSLFSDKHMDLNLLYQQSADFAHAPNWLGEVDALGAKVLVETINALFRKAESGEIIEHLLPLEALMSTLTAFDASDPRDTIYAILRLSHDAKPGSKATYEVASPYPSSPHLGPTPGNDSPFSALILTHEPDAIFSPPSRSTTDSSIGDATPMAGSHFLSIPENPHLSRRRRSNSVLGAVHKREAETDPHTGKGQEAKLILVDYDKKVFDVCKEFLNFVIERSRSLDIICRPWAPPAEEGEPDLPSWIPSIRNRPFGIMFRTHDQGQDVTYSRVAADPLVGTPGTGYRSYNASGNTRAYRRHFKGQALDIIDGRTLVTCGFVLDKIGHREPPATDAIIPKSWPAVVSWTDPSGPLPDNFWRTLVADRAVEGPAPAPIQFKLACKWAFSRKPGANVNIQNLLMGLHGRCPSIAKTFLRRVQAVVFDRSLFLSEGEDGDQNTWLLGLAPENAEVGDLICILYGCSVPVILRETARHDSFSKPRRALTMPVRKARFSDPPEMTASSRPSVGGLPRSGTFASTQQPDLLEDEEAMTYVSPTLSHSSMGSPTMTTSSARTSTSTVVQVEAAEPVDGQTTVQTGRMAETGDAAGEAVTPTKPKKAGRRKTYVFIGECYVHGMMDGDAFRRKVETNSPLQEFLLV